MSTTVDTAPTDTAETRAARTRATLAAARTTFRTWRRGRPFWGGLLVVLAGAEIFFSGQMDLGHVHLQFGVEGMQAMIIPIVLVLLGVLIWAMPVHRVFYGVIALVLSVYSLIGVNLGGFIVGMVLGIVGGVVAVSWLPRATGEAAAAAGPSDESDAGTGVPSLPDDAAGQGSATEIATEISDTDVLAAALADEPLAPRPFLVPPAEAGTRRAPRRAGAIGLGLLASTLSAGLATQGVVPAQAAPSDASSGIICQILGVACPPTTQPTPTPTPTASPSDGPSAPTSSPSSDPGPSGDGASDGTGATGGTAATGGPSSGAGSASGDDGTSGSGTDAEGTSDAGDGTGTGRTHDAGDGTGSAAADGDGGTRSSGTSADATAKAADAPADDDSQNAAEKFLNALLTAIPAPVLAPSASDPVVPALAAHLTGSKLELTNSRFVGIATLKRTDGSTVRVLKFSADKVVVPDFSLDVPNGDGHGLVGASQQMTESGHVTLYATKLTASLLGQKLIFTPDAPPPPVIPLPSMDSPKIELVSNGADTNIQAGSHQHLY